MANERKDSSEESTLEQTEEEQKAGEERAQQDNAGEDLTKLLEDSRAKAEEHWDQLLRMRAEMDNLNKRHTRELENAHKFALDNFVRELLLVWDSLELGLNAAHEESADIDKLREGMDMTVKVFADAMEKFGVEQIDPQGESFNPEYHQAMSMQARDDMPPNHVVTVVQKGCMLNGRLVRPAMVIVSQAPS
jgi:molecular chaperone GrpE